MTNWSCQGRKAQHKECSNEVILKKRNWDKVLSMSSGNANNEERREMISCGMVEASGMHWTMHWNILQLREVGGGRGK